MPRKFASVPFSHVAEVFGRMLCIAAGQRYDFCPNPETGPGFPTSRFPGSVGFQTLKDTLRIRDPPGRALLWCTAAEESAACAVPNAAKIRRTATVKKITAKKSAFHNYFVTLRCKKVCKL